MALRPSLRIPSLLLGVVAFAVPAHAGVPGVIVDSARTLAHGVRDGALTVGRTTRAFFLDGTDAAAETWDDNVELTREHARRNVDRVREEAGVDREPRYDRDHDDDRGVDRDYDRGYDDYGRDRDYDRGEDRGDDRGEDRGYDGGDDRGYGRGDDRDYDRRYDEDYDRGDGRDYDRGHDDRY
jgi:hypothetical protein